MRRPRTVAGRFGDRGARSGTRGAHRATARPLVGREPATARGGAQHRGRGAGPDPGSGGTAGTTGGRIAATRRSRPATLHAQRARRPPPGARTDAPVGRPPPARQGRRFLLPPVFQAATRRSRPQRSGDPKGGGGRNGGGTPSSPTQKHCHGYRKQGNKR